MMTSSLSAGRSYIMLLYEVQYISCSLTHYNNYTCVYIYQGWQNLEFLRKKILYLFAIVNRLLNDKSNWTLNWLMNSFDKYIYLRNGKLKLHLLS